MLDNQKGEELEFLILFSFIDLTYIVGSIGMAFLRDQISNIFRNKYLNLNPAILNL